MRVKRYLVQKHSEVSPGLNRKTIFFASRFLKLFHMSMWVKNVGEKGGEEVEYSVVPQTFFFVQRNQNASRMLVLLWIHFLNAHLKTCWIVARLKSNYSEVNSN